MLSGFNLLTSVDLPVDRLPCSLGKRGPSCPKFVLSALCKSSRTLSPQPCQLLSLHPLSLLISHSSVWISLGSSFGSLHVHACCSSSLYELYPLPFLSDSRLTFIISMLLIVSDFQITVQNSRSIVHEKLTHSAMRRPRPKS